MNVDETLDRIEELFEESASLPFTGGKRMVDVDKARDLIDDVRLNMPAEVKQAKAIVKDRAEIISGANKEAESIIKKAEDRARAMVDQEEVVRQAKARAQELVQGAQQQSREMRSAVTDYCESMLRQTEESLVGSATDVRNMRSTLRQKAGK